MTKVEEVARAIYCRPLSPSTAAKKHATAWEKAPRQSRARCLADARAAIAAMRELGKQIQDASTLDDAVYLGGHLDAYSFTTVWEAGIDAILAESHPSPSIQRGEGK